MKARGEEDWLMPPAYIVLQPAPAELNLPDDATPPTRVLKGEANQIVLSQHPYKTVVHHDLSHQSQMKPQQYLNCFLQDNIRNLGTRRSILKTIEGDKQDFS